MIQVVVIAFLLVFIIMREVIIYKEMQKLTDKIIARDYTEYTSGIVALEAEKTKRTEKRHDVNKLYKV